MIVDPTFKKEIKQEFIIDECLYDDDAAVLLDVFIIDEWRLAYTWKGRYRLRSFPFATSV